jgi:hypothetical protein
MTTRHGYLANVTNIPPLIFRFQFHPELLSEKKSFGYRETNTFGAWGFDQTKGAKPGLSKLAGLSEDIKEFGSRLVNTKALEADVGKPRVIALDFALDARTLSATSDDKSDSANQFGGKIEPSLAVLRSFMNPSYDVISDLASWVIGANKFCPPTRPPICTLKLSDLELDCVMTDLNIKITKFKSDLTPERAEVSLTLNEQTHSLATSLDVLQRVLAVGESLAHTTGNDWLQATPGAGFVQNVKSLF